MKITNDGSREIYDLAKDPKNNLTNRELGEKFGIDEATVRYHVKKWEGKLHEIAKTNEKAASAIANHTVNVHAEATDILAAVKDSIQIAKNNGVSPEKLAPLYNNWIKSLEFASQLLGELKSPVVEIQFNQLKSVVVGELCENCKQKLKEKLYEVVSR